MMLESHFGGDDDDDDNDDDDDDDEPVPEHGDRAATCAECLAAGKDYCIADNRCTKRATRTCAGPEDHVTGSPEFARTSPGHSMKCPKPDADGERGFLARGGPLAHHGRRGFPVLLEVRGKTSHELMHDLRAHVAELSATGCETAGEPCQVSFELYECPVHARRAPAHHHHRHHRHGAALRSHDFLLRPPALRRALSRWSSELSAE